MPTKRKSTAPKKSGKPTKIWAKSKGFQQRHPKEPYAFRLSIPTGYAEVFFFNISGHRSIRFFASVRYSRKSCATVELENPASIDRIEAACTAIGFKWPRQN